MTVEPSPEERSAAQELLALHPFATGLSDSEVAGIVDLAEFRIYESGEELIEEGTRSRTLIMLVSGSADVCKRDESGDEHVLNRVSGGEIIGEMSFFQGEPTSASVRADGPVEAMLVHADVVSRDALGHAYERLRGNVGELVMDRQRRLSDRQLAILRKSRQQEKERREYGVFFSVIVILVGIDHAVAEISRDPRVDVTSQTFSWGALLVFALPLGFFIRYTRHPLSVFGLTFAGWRTSLREALLLAVPLAALAVGAKWVYRELGWVDPTAPLFTTRTLEASAMLLPGLAGVVVSRIQGFFHHFMQELLMRGVVQGSLYRLYGRESPLSAILASSAIFATAHMFISLPFALLTFVGGCFFGWVYARHGTLLGVTVLHFLLHTTVKFLGFL